MHKKLKDITNKIYSKYGNKIQVVHIFDKSLLSNFNLSGEMMISHTAAYKLAAVMCALSLCAREVDIEFVNPNK